MKVQRRSSPIKAAAVFLVLLTAVLPMSKTRADNWYEKDPGYFTLFDEEGGRLTVMASEMFKDDEYISGDNRHYSIYSVDKKSKYAFAKFIGDIELPQFEEVVDETVETLAQKDKNRSILLYCTHSDESYVPSDGKSSIPSEGGIYDVAESFRDSLEKKGVKAVLDKTSHDPHDAGAYRRSRQTAMDLIRKNTPVAAVFDIHRDAIPKEHYDAMVNGEYMSRVRIVIGRSNQNRKANEQLAYKIKAIADKAYPGLIKDIYIGKGEYNQELSPRSLLFELGTHEISKEAAQKATDNLADVVHKAIFGGVFKSKEPADKGQKKGQAQAPKDKRLKVSPISQEEQKGAGRGIMWFIVVAVVGFVIFTLISKSGNEIKSSFENITGKKKRE